jgi:hypothetical protein
MMEPLVTTTAEASELKETVVVMSQNGDASIVPPPETTTNGSKAAGQDETNPKAENSGWGLECHVLDEFVVAKVMPDTEGSRTKEEVEGGKDGKGKDQWGGKNKKRGQNKNRPIFQQNPKVKRPFPIMLYYSRFIFKSVLFEEKDSNFLHIFA